MIQFSHMTHVSVMEIIFTTGQVKMEMGDGDTEVEEEENIKRNTRRKYFKNRGNI